MHRGSPATVPGPAMPAPSPADATRHRRSSTPRVPRGGRRTPSGARAAPRWRTPVSLAGLAFLLACGHGGHDAWQMLPLDAEVAACAAPAQCGLRLHDAAQAAASGSGRVAVLRLAPTLALQVRADPHVGCAADWAERDDAAVVFNAGFYDARRRHVGWLRDAAGWHQPARHRDWQGLLVSGPQEARAGAARTRLLDLQRENADEALPYAHQAQSMVLFDAQGTLRCRNSAAAASRCVVATDADGTLYVAVTQGAWTLGGLADWLRRRYPTLVQAINLDGGHEAQLAVRSPAGSWDFFGEHGGRGPSLKGRRTLPYVWTLTAREAGFGGAPNAAAQPFDANAASTGGQ